MSIWSVPVTLETFTSSRKNTMVDHLGIEFIEVGDNYVRARMPVDDRTRQPMGIMHGGASCALAETAASVAANFCIDPTKKVCVGLEINTSHVRMAKEGYVIATARPRHLGKTTQLWEIDIVDQTGALVSVNRLRMAVLDIDKSS